MAVKARLDLEAIEARANAATDGPWHNRRALQDGRTVDTTRVSPEADCNALAETWMHRLGYSPLAPPRYDAVANASFIAHAREDLPALIAEVRRLRALVGEG